MDRSFLDPQTSEDGTPYGPKRFKELVRECWFISENLNTSYTDILDISSVERAYLLEFIHEKHEATQKAIDEARNKGK